MQLHSLHPHFDRLQKRHGAKGLCAIYGAGSIERPELMLVFMNPTGRNISTGRDWKGLRAPWLGTKNIWKLLYSTGVISRADFEKTQSLAPKDWTPEFCDELYGSIAEKKVFVTNLAKCTQADARALPDSVFRGYLELFKQEIALVRPKRIVTFGNQVSSILLGCSIKVSEYKGRENEELKVDGKAYPVFPTFYPVGQGMRNLPLAARRIRQILK